MNPFPTIVPQSQKVIDVSEAEREQQNNETPRKPSNESSISFIRQGELIKKDWGENFLSINKDEMKDHKNEVCSWRNSIAYPPETYPTY